MDFANKTCPFSTYALKKLQTKSPKSTKVVKIFIHLPSSLFFYFPRKIFEFWTFYDAFSEHFLKEFFVIF